MRKFYDLTLCVPGTPTRKFGGNGSFDVAGAIGSGLSFIGGLVTNSTNKKIAREQMAQQERLFNTQMDYTKAAEMRQYEYADKAWDRETAYNDPAAQKARFEAAGLNPALMMQGQNAAIGSMESVNAPSAPSAPSVPSYQVQDPITPAVQTYLNSRVSAAQARKMEEEANQIGIDNQTREYANILSCQEQLQRINKLISARQADNANTDYLKTLRDFYEEQLSIMEQSHAARVNQENQKAYLLNQQGQQVEEQVKALQIDNFFRRVEHQLGIKMSRASIKRIGSQIELDKAMTKREIANWAKTILEAAGLVPDSPLYELNRRRLEAEIGKLNRESHLGVDWNLDPETGTSSPYQRHMDIN